MTQNLSTLIALFLFSTLTFACRPDVKEVAIKDYRIAVLSQDQKVIDAFQKLINEYNQQAGFQALSFVEKAENANSPILFTKGLSQRDGKIGWGQWMSESEGDSELGGFYKQEISRTVNYSMRLELDEDYVSERIGSKERNDHYELQKLLFHEVGHGLQMDHDPNRSDVMYYDVTGTKDFNGYFRRVRSFFGRDPG